MSKKSNAFTRLGMLAMSAMMLSGTAQAVDLRSWDVKINNAANRFIVLDSFNGLAVLDKETQLVWERSPGKNAGPLAAALNVCANRVVGGRKGWRLPSFDELASLVNPTAAPGTLALMSGHPFTDVPNSYYWAATKKRNSMLELFYVVKFHDAGLVDTTQPSFYAHYWCVRGGRPISEY